MNHTLISYSKENGTIVMTQNKEIKETEKLVITLNNRYKKASFNFYMITNEELNETQKNKAFFMLDNVFYYSGHVLQNGEKIEHYKRENIFLIGDEIVSRGDFEDIFRSEIGLRVD